MTLDLSEFLSAKDKKGHFEVPLEMEKFKTRRMALPVSKKTPVSVDVQNIGKKKILLEIACCVEIIFPCDRCLKDVTKEFHIREEKEIDMNESQADRMEDLDMAYISGSHLDVETFVHNEILVNLPMKVLCSENCKGICNRCGVNLNLQSCNCDTGELDPRMSKILDVFNNFKEV